MIFSPKNISQQTNLFSFTDHITSQSAIRMPLEKLIPLCKEYGVMTLIDGAHAPGQIPLNLKELDADFYSGKVLTCVCKASKQSENNMGRSTLKTLLVEKISNRKLPITVSLLVMQ